MKGRLDESMLDCLPANGCSERSGHQAVHQHEPESLFFPTEVHVLVVDNESVLDPLASTVLARPEFVVDSVARADQLEGKLTARNYHLILLDHAMPGLDPDRVFEWMRHYQPDAMVIVVTAKPSLECAVSGLRARIYDYLVKPVEPARLEEVVRRCLESKGLLRLSEEALRESLGNAIRQRRKALGLTLAQMADRTRVSLGYLSQIELGKNSASLETLYRICLGLGVELSDLFEAIRS